MVKKYPDFDKLPPEVQQAVHAYWNSIKAKSRERAKLRSF
jgi:hypothetical protein